MAILESHVRTLLNNLDELAVELSEELENNYDLDNNSELEQLHEQLNDLQSLITNIQEKQGWI